MPFAKKLDAKLARLEAKLVAPIQWLLQRVSDHSGIINEIISIQRVLQDPVFTRSIYSYQANLVNLWWNSQTVPRTAQRQQQANAVAQAIALKPGQTLLDKYLDTGVYDAPPSTGPGQDELDNLLENGF